jgi:hypothetical protein
MSMNPKSPLYTPPSLESPFETASPQRCQPCQSAFCVIVTTFLHPFTAEACKPSELNHINNLSRQNSVFFMSGQTLVADAIQTLNS